MSVITAPSIASETLLTLKAVAGRYRSPATGRQLHVNSVRRWARKGVRGVRLEVLAVGGLVYTSEEALARWRTAIAAAKTERPRLDVGALGRSTARLSAAYRRAKAINDRRVKG
jgi:hypothetical protein